MKVGDLVTVGPAADDVYLVLAFLRYANAPEEQEQLGSLWLLHNADENSGMVMHEKWLWVVGEAVDK